MIGIGKFCSEVCYFQYQKVSSKKHFRAIEYSPRRVKEVEELTEFAAYQLANPPRLLTGFRKVYKGKWVGKGVEKSKPYRDKGYLRFLNTQPCCTCGKIGESEAAHTEHRGLASKGDDLSSISLCPECHRGSKGLDSLGKEKFEQYHKVNVKDSNIKHLREYIKYLKAKDK